MRELALAGAIAIAFGLGSWYATRDAAESLGWFHQLNISLGALALVVATALSLRRLGAFAQQGLRGVLRRGFALVLGSLVLAVGAERLANWSQLEFDWTLDRRFALSEAVERALAEFGDEVELRLYYDEQDPRIRSTRLLLHAMENAGAGRMRELRLEDHPEDADRFGIGSSNSVVVLRGERFETVGRPTEGALYEALYRLRSVEAGRIWVARGGGEGDIERTDPAGYSGLAQALVTEGYRLRAFVAAQGLEIPPEADAVLLIAPRRYLPETALAALDAYLERGGRLLALLEPGVETGLEALLTEWGLASPDAVLVDPASGRIDDDTPGVNPLAYHYGRHPVARSLDPSRMTFFRGARSFVLRKPQSEDELADVVLASPRSWLSEDLGVLTSGVPPSRPAAASPDYHPLVVAGRYPRAGVDTRVVAFGDADFASNRHLRTLYNLDLMLNAVHWVMAREPEIKILPKASVSGNLQFALPIQNTLTRFYGVGVLIPELLLMAGAIIWLRTRSA